MSPDKVQAYLADLPLWTLAPDGASIQRQFTARNFKAAMAFVNTMADLAEAETHHPDFTVSNYRCA